MNISNPQWWEDIFAIYNLCYILYDSLYSKTFIKCNVILKDECVDSADWCSLIPDAGDCLRSTIISDQYCQKTCGSCQPLVADETETLSAGKHFTYPT